MPVGAILFSEMTPAPEWEGAFHTWYDTHHIPIRMAAPGFLGAGRYQRMDGPGFLAVYDMADEGTLQTPEYAVIKGQPSAETAWMLENVSGFTRHIGSLIGQQTRPEVSEAEMLASPFLYAVLFDVPADRQADFDAWYDQDHVPLLLGCKDWLGCRRYSLNVSHPEHFTHIALHHLADMSALESPARAAARASDWRARIAAEPWFKGTYMTFAARGDRFAPTGDKA